MSSSPIHSTGTSSSISIRRGENNNHYLSKIIRVVLATLGTIASYAFLPSIGATIVSSIIILATIRSFYKSKSDGSSDTFSTSDTILSSGSSSTTVFISPPVSHFPSPVIITPPRQPWYNRFTPYMSSWFPNRRTLRVPVATGKATTPSQTFRSGCRPVVRERADSSAPRVPVGSGRATPSAAIPLPMPTYLRPSASRVPVGTREATAPLSTSQRRVGRPSSANTSRVPSFSSNTTESSLSTAMGAGGRVIAGTRRR